MKRSVMFRILVLALTLALAFTFAACGGGDKPAEKPAEESKTEEPAPEPEAPAESEGGDEPQAPAEQRTYAIVYPVIHQFFDPVTEGAEAYAKELGNIELIIQAPEGGIVQQQIEIMENLISMKVDGIAIGSTDPEALAPYIDQAVDAGIQVITFDTDTPNCKRAGYLGTMNYEAGVFMGHVIAKHLDNKGKVIILQDVPTQGNLVERLQGIQDTIESEYPDISILDVQSGYADPAKSVEVLEAMIEANPDFDCYTGIGGAGGPAGIAVWKSRGWTSEDKKIITFDNTDENLDGLRNGIITALVSQRQHTWGKLIIDSLNTLLEGGTIPEQYDTGVIEVTLDNIDTYQDEN